MINNRRYSYNKNDEILQPTQLDHSPVCLSNDLGTLRGLEQKHRSVLECRL